MERCQGRAGQGRVQADASRARDRVTGGLIGGLTTRTRNQYTSRSGQGQVKGMSATGMSSIRWVVEGPLRTVGAPPKTFRPQLPIPPALGPRPACRGLVLFGAEALLVEALLSLAISLAAGVDQERLGRRQSETRREKCLARKNELPLIRRREIGPRGCVEEEGREGDASRMRDAGGCCSMFQAQHLLARRRRSHPFSALVRSHHCVTNTSQPCQPALVPRLEPMT